MPRGLAHTFANLHDEPVRGIGLINPPGLTHFFADGRVRRLGRRRAGPSTILEINQRYGVFPAEGQPLI